VIVNAAVSEQAGGAERDPTLGRLDEPDAEAVLREINGWDSDGHPLSAYTELQDDGSTACGCWIYCGCYAGGENTKGLWPWASVQGWKWSPPTPAVSGGITG